MMINGQILRPSSIAEDVPDFADQDEPILGECPMCGALQEPIGQLGSRVHFTCRCCGAWFSEEAK